MADSRRGKKLTEEHRQAQLAVRAAFLKMFMDQWELLDPNRLDETGVAWARTVSNAIEEHWAESADVAERYYRDFRMAEAPTVALSTPVPRLNRASTSGLRRRPRQVGRGTGEAVPVSTGDLVAPRIVYNDDAAKTSLIVTGPVNIKAKTKRGKSPEEAARQALVEAGGSAARHVLSGGRAAHLELVRSDPEAQGWMRVTDGDPCAFCAMLSSRGPRYKSEQSAERVVNPKAKRALGEPYHDHCGCTAEAVFSNSQAWPGRGREFQQLWRDATKGFSGKDAINAFRRAYERGIREAGRQSEAG